MSPVLEVLITNLMPLALPPHLRDLLSILPSIISLVLLDY